MARLEKVQTSLIKGILSPRIRGRLDFQGFFDGADSIENMFVLPQGGGTRRSGTRFVAETKDSTKLSRLVNFQFSVDQTYEIEFGEFYTRFSSYRRSWWNNATSLPRRSRARASTRGISAPAGSLDEK